MYVGFWAFRAVAALVALAAAFCVEVVMSGHSLSDGTGAAVAELLKEHVRRRQHLVEKLSEDMAERPALSERQQAQPVVDRLGDTAGEAHVARLRWPVSVWALRPAVLLHNQHSAMTVRYCQH